MRSFWKKSHRKRRPAVKSPITANLEILEERTLLSGVELTAVGTYSTGSFDEGAAEIAAYDADTQRVFFTNADANEVTILDASDPTNPTRIASIDMSSYGGGVNSVDVANGIVAVAVEANVKTDPGSVVFFDVDGNYLNAVTVGALPDMLTFTPDGTKVLVANEGEPLEADQPISPANPDPQGSISIIDLSSGIASPSVNTLNFEQFDSRVADLRADGVRMFPGRLPSRDLEPEYVSVSPDGSTAFVTLQEANAFAVVDIDAGEISGIQPLGVSDHSRGLPSLSTYDFTELPNLGTTALGETIKLGGFSGLSFEGVDPVTGNYQFITVPDRGPNGDSVNGERPFLLPDYQARVVSFELNPTTGEITITNQLLLTRDDGGSLVPITGLPNIVGVDEVPVDAAGDPVGYDPFGADLEGVVRAPDGSLWMVDEYRPSIYHFGSDGVLIDRFIPQGTAAQVGDPAGTYGTETLPADYLNRRSNRGFEGMALDTDSGVLYAFIQTPLSNPDRAAGNASSVIRMLGIDPATGNPVSEYVYLLQKPDVGGNVDKIGDAVYAGDGKFYVMERDSGLDPTSQKFLFEVNLTGATNVLGYDFGAETLEQQTPDDLAAAGIHPVNKIKVANLPSLGYLPSDKTEGIAVLPDGRIALMNDNDFIDFPEQLGIIDFSTGNGLDASDKDDVINITNWPVYGMYMPDAVASYSVGGQTYYVTANEGDSRDFDESRVKDLTLDPTAFPDAATLQANGNLGRLTVSNIDGDLDGDGDFDQLYAFGNRSFSIWDSNGNQVFDSGDDFEQITAAMFPNDFNANNDENDSFESRSDNKGPEPEGVTTGVINGRTFAFIGLERIGGIMIYDVTDPTNPVFSSYVNNRDFSVDAQLPDGSTNPAVGDLGVEGVTFVSAEDSPNGVPLVIAANEVSGTLTFFQVSGSVVNDGVLELIGTSGDDDILITRDGPGSVEVTTQFGATTTTESFADLSLIRVTTLEGDDTVIATPFVSTNLFVNLGAGNDVGFGGAGNDIFLGGSGNDLLGGGSGRNVLIGGTGRDILLGGYFGGSLLIGGTTAYDNDADALNLILDEWSSNSSLKHRVRNLSRGTGSVLSGTGIHLDGHGRNATVFDDGDPDYLVGGLFSQDWFFAKLSGRRAHRDHVFGLSFFDELDRI